MKKLFIIFCFSVALSSCDLIIKGVTKKAAETVENLAEEEPNPPPEKKEGIIKSYYNSGKLKTSINYKNGLKNGEAITYYENGNIKLSMNYINGVKDGPSNYYYENGKIYRESNYVNGELDGIRKIYNKGRLTAEVPYKNGHTGIGLKEYFTNGNVKEDYPRLLFEEVDARKESHTYSIKIRFDKVHPKDKFYVGDLDGGIYLHNDLYPLLVENGVGILPLDIPQNATGSQVINFIGVHHTKLGNSYVTEHSYNLVIR